MKSSISILVAGIALCMLSSLVQADDLEDDFSTVWESLWDQRGMPRRVSRWDQDINVRFQGLDVSTHREHVLKSLQLVTEEAGIVVTDVSDHADAEKTANLEVEFVSQNALADSQPCATYLNDRKGNGILKKVTIMMRVNRVWRCSLHEAMHVMGIVGHPFRGTVLSYFSTRRDVLMNLDKIMLRAWYSPNMKPGMTPFEALSVLTDEVMRANGRVDTAAHAARERFFGLIVSEMEAYARGEGEVPPVVKRSGKAASESMRHGQNEMSYYLGMAYDIGVVVKPDAALSIQWLTRAASEGHNQAQVRLANALENGKGGARDLIEAYKWYSLAAKKDAAARENAERLHVRLTPEQLREARERMTRFQP